MQIWPAIDLRGGRCVRLQQGDYDRETVFDDDPAAAAKKWVNQGAGYLHLVDLDGARDGQVANREAVREILNAIDVPCELGGGIRNDQTVRDWLEAGISRVVIGTRALKDVDWFRRMCNEFPQRIALGLDARSGRLATDGWLKTSELNAVEFATQVQQEPIAAIIYTDIAKDGMMMGPNLEAIAEMQEAVETPVIASGGVATVDDVRRLAEIGVTGCIVGRALYDNKLTIADAIEAAKLAK
jgi:phosphoribosylformimino-5-aminoimidazole carboxamide ribotide isomerase